MERTDERFDPMFDHDNPRFPEVEPVLPPEPQPQDTQQYAGVEYQRTLSGEDQERKMEEEKEFLDLKNALMNYDFKKSPRIQKEIYGNLDGSDIDVVRIALFGPTGSGKTTLIGTLQRALGENQSAVGGEEDVLVQEYYVQKNIQLVDTRGFSLSEENLLEECRNILSGKIRAGEEIPRSYDPGYDSERQHWTARKSESLAKHAHGVILVVEAGASYLENNTESLKRIREEFIANDYDPVTVITGLDNLGNEERKNVVIDKVCEACGSSPENTFFIANYMYKDKGRSLAVDRTALDILDRVLLSAEKFISIRKQKEKAQIQRRIAVERKTRPVHGLKEGISEFETLEKYFARLEQKHKWTDLGKGKDVLWSLRSMKISTVKALKEIWAGVKKKLPLSIGIKTVLEVEMKKIPMVIGNFKRGLITSEGGVVTLEGIQVVCPPAAVDSALTVEVTREEPFKYYGQIVNRGLENDVVFASPVIKLQPNGQSFKKLVTVKTYLDGDVTDIESYRVLHGTQNYEDQIVWQDITHASSIDSEQKEVTVQIDKFSFLTVVKRLTSFPIETISSLLNVFPFTYTLSVLFKVNPYTPSRAELSFVFKQRDLYRELFYGTHQNCALDQLKEDGFQELCFNGSQDSSYPVYNQENLEISVDLGEDYQLQESSLVLSDKTVFRIKVEPSVWRSTGHIIPLPLQGAGASEFRILCGRVNVRGEHGHFNDGSFCELDTCGYLKRLLGIEGRAVINVAPIAQKLKAPDQTVTQIVDEFWQKEDEQLEKVLEQWSKENGNSKEFAALRKALEGLTPEVYKVKERGQMHVIDLRETARKMLELKHDDAQQMKYFANHVQTLLPNILRDCCIEMATTKDEVEIAASTDDCEHLLVIHGRITEDFANKLQQVISSSSSSLIAAFSSIVPRLLQLIKEIFQERRIEAVLVQNGLKGLFKETVNSFTDEVRNAEQRKSIPRMLCEVCKILEALCLKNRGSHSTEEILKWGQSLQSVSLLKLLETFFQSCEESKLYTRLDMFLGSLRDIMAELTTVEEMVLRNFYDLSLSLIHFAKFDPSKVVKFELTGPANSSLTFHSETIKYDTFQDTFSQRFQLRKGTDDCLELRASAIVYQQGQVGAFESDILLPLSTKPVLDRLYLPVEIKTKPEDSECVRVVLRSTQKENIAKALTMLQEEIEDGAVEWGKTEIKKAPLTVRSSAKAGTVIGLRLVYKWKSQAIVLDSKDFEALADSTQGPYTLAVDVQRADPLSALPGPLAAASSRSVIPDGDGDGDDRDLSPAEVVERHTHKQCERIEIHYHNTVIQGHNCVVGNNGVIADHRPTSGNWCDTSQRALTEPTS